MEQPKWGRVWPGTNLDDAIVCEAGQQGGLGANGDAILRVKLQLLFADLEKTHLEVGLQRTLVSVKHACCRADGRAKPAPSREEFSAFHSFSQSQGELALFLKACKKDSEQSMKSCWSCFRASSVLARASERRTYNTTLHP